MGDDDRPIKFVHVPKTAGTSICDALSIKGPHKPALLRARNEPDWDDAVRFTFIRNPWDHVMSWYFWAGLFRTWAFEDWVDAGMPCRDADFHGVSPINQALFFQDKQGRELVHFVGRFELLPEDFETLCRDHLGIEPPRLPHKNASPLPVTSTTKRDRVAYRYSRLYSGRTWRAVGDRFGDFCEKYGYPVDRVAPVARVKWRSRRLQAIFAKHRELHGL